MGETVRSPEELAAENWRDALRDIARPRSEWSEAQAAALTSRFREALLRFGSDSDDNRACAEHLAIGIIGKGGDEGTRRVAPYVRELGRAVTEVLWSAEGCAIPEELATAIPDLRPAQWDACLRVATLALLAFESDAPGVSP